MEYLNRKTVLLIKLNKYSSQSIYIFSYLCTFYNSLLFPKLSWEFKLSPIFPGC